MLYKVVQRVGRNSYKLKLLESIDSTYLVFHTSLLRPDLDDPLQGQHMLPQPLVLVENEDSDDEDTHEEWEVEEIVDS